MELAERQLDFGLKKLNREPGMTKSKAGDDFAAFFDLEYNDGLKQEDIENAKAEIEAAIINLYNSPIFSELTIPGVKLVIQRNLQLPSNGFNILAIPDLILFKENCPPHIIDWKVHEGRYTDYWQQLSVYAYVLSKLASTKPHKDFPKEFINACHKAHTYSVTESQLLKNKEKHYVLTEKDIDDVEDFIHITSQGMSELYEERNEIDPSYCSTTYYAATCRSCQFKRLCQEVDSHVKN